MPIPTADRGPPGASHTRAINPARSTAATDASISLARCHPHTGVGTATKLVLASMHLVAGAVLIPVLARSAGARH